MTILKIAIFSFLMVIVSSNAEASLNNNVTQFCGERYCGYSNGESVKKKRVAKTVKARHRITIRKEKKEKRIQVASLGNGITSESPSLLSKAKSYLGTNPTGWNSLWCARFIAVIAPSTAERLKRMGLNPNWARDYALLPGAKRKGRIGDIVVLTRGKGGHIGILKDFDKHGNPIIVSGNHGHKVGIGVYPKRRVIAYVSV